MKLKEIKTDGITFKLLANTCENTSFILGNPIENYTLILEVSADNIKIAEIPVNQQILDDLKHFVDEISNKIAHFNYIKEYKNQHKEEWKYLENKSKNLESKNLKDKTAQALDGFIFQELSRKEYEQNHSNR